jgi:hypothetical protein
MGSRLNNDNKIHNSLVDGFDKLVKSIPPKEKNKKYFADQKSVLGNSIGLKTDFTV